MQGGTPGGRPPPRRGRGRGATAAAAGRGAGLAARGREPCERPPTPERSDGEARPPQPRRSRRRPVVGGRVMVASGRAGACGCGRGDGASGGGRDWVCDAEGSSASGGGVMGKKVGWSDGKEPEHRRSLRGNEGPAVQPGGTWRRLILLFVLVARTLNRRRGRRPRVLLLFSVAAAR